MPSLYRRSIVYADIKNVVVSTDAIVASRLKRYFEEHHGASFFFVESLQKLQELPIEALVCNIMAEKKNHNFLLDYFDWTKVGLDDDVDPITICNFTYKDILKMPVTDTDILENPDISNLMTGIGKSLHLLCSDKNLDTIYLYQEEYFPEEIIKGLNFFYMGNQKIKYVLGDKKDFFKDHLCDSYFFEDCDSIDKFICRKHSGLSEVLVPATEPNLTIVDKEKNTCLRLLSTQSPSKYYKENFNLEVHTIGLPI